MGLHEKGKFSIHGTSSLFFLWNRTVYGFASFPEITSDATENEFIKKHDRFHPFQHAKWG